MWDTVGIEYRDAVLIEKDGVKIEQKEEAKLEPQNEHENSELDLYDGFVPRPLANKNKITNDNNEKEAGDEKNSKIKENNEWLDKNENEI